MQVCNLNFKCFGKISILLAVTLLVFFLLAARDWAFIWVCLSSPFRLSFFTAATLSPSLPVCLIVNCCWFVLSGTQTMCVSVCVLLEVPSPKKEVSKQQFKKYEKTTFTDVAAEKQWVTTVVSSSKTKLKLKLNSDWLTLTLTEWLRQAQTSVQSHSV